jgi:hypothetical protein
MSQGSRGRGEGAESDLVELTGGEAQLETSFETFVGSFWKQHRVGVEGEVGLHDEEIGLWEDETEESGGQSRFPTEKAQVAPLN